MSTLVKLLFAIVLQVLHTGETPQTAYSEHQIEQVTCESGLQQLNPHYIISRNELLSQLNERAL